MDVSLILNSFLSSIFLAPCSSFDFLLTRTSCFGHNIRNVTKVFIIINLIANSV